MSAHWNICLHDDETRKEELETITSYVSCHVPIGNDKIREYRFTRGNPINVVAFYVQTLPPSVTTGISESLIVARVKHLQKIIDGWQLLLGRTNHQFSAYVINEFTSKENFLSEFELQNFVEKHPWTEPVPSRLVPGDRVYPHEVEKKLRNISEDYVGTPNYDWLFSHKMDDVELCTELEQAYGARQKRVLLGDFKIPRPEAWEFDEFLDDIQRREKYKIPIKEHKPSRKKLICSFLGRITPSRYREFRVRYTRQMMNFEVTDILSMISNVRLKCRLRQDETKYKLFWAGVETGVNVNTAPYLHAMFKAGKDAVEEFEFENLFLRATTWAEEDALTRFFRFFSRTIHYETCHDAEILIDEDPNVTQNGIEFMKHFKATGDSDAAFDKVFFNTTPLTEADLYPSTSSNGNKEEEKEQTQATFADNTTSSRSATSSELSSRVDTPQDATNKAELDQEPTIAKEPEPEQLPTPKPALSYAKALKKSAERIPVEQVPAPSQLAVPAEKPVVAVEEPPVPMQEQQQARNNTNKPRREKNSKKNENDRGNGQQVAPKQKEDRSKNTSNVNGNKVNGASSKNVEQNRKPSPPTKASTPEPKQQQKANRVDKQAAPIPPAPGANDASSSACAAGANEQNGAMSPPSQKKQKKAKTAVADQTGESKAADEKTKNDAKAASSDQKNDADAPGANKKSDAETATSGQKDDAHVPSGNKKSDSEAATFGQKEKANTPGANKKNDAQAATSEQKDEVNAPGAKKKNDSKTATSAQKKEANAPGTNNKSDAQAATSAQRDDANAPGANKKSDAKATASVQKDKDETADSNKTNDAETSTAAQKQQAGPSNKKQKKDNKPKATAQKKKVEAPVSNQRQEPAAPVAQQEEAPAQREEVPAPVLAENGGVGVAVANDAPEQRAAPVAPEPNVVNDAPAQRNAFDAPEPIVPVPAIDNGVPEERAAPLPPDAVNKAPEPVDNAPMPDANKPGPSEPRLSKSQKRHMRKAAIKASEEQEIAMLDAATKALEEQEAARFDAASTDMLKKLIMSADDKTFVEAGIKVKVQNSNTKHKHKKKSTSKATTGTTIIKAKFDDNGAGVVVNNVVLNDQDAVQHPELPISSSSSDNEEMSVHNSNKVIAFDYRPEVTNAQNDDAPEQEGTELKLMSSKGCSAGNDSDDDNEKVPSDPTSDRDNVPLANPNDKVVFVASEKSHHNMFQILLHLSDNKRALVNFDHGKQRLIHQRLLKFRNIYFFRRRIARAMLYILAEDQPADLTGTRERDMLNKLLLYMLVDYDLDPNSAQAREIDEMTKDVTPNGVKDSNAIHSGLKYMDLRIVELVPGSDLSLGYIKIREKLVMMTGQGTLIYNIVKDKTDLSGYEGRID